MKRFTKIGLSTLGFGALAFGLSTVPNHPAHAGAGAPVTVLNTPLPVQGTVNAAQSGSWNVNIANMPTINLAEGSSVRDADNPARNVVSFANSGLPSCTLDNDCAVTLGQVPSGKRLVVEYLAATACIPVGQTVQVGISSSDTNNQINDNVTGIVFLPMSQPAVAGESGFICDGNGTTSVGQAVRFYVEPGKYVIGFGQRNKGDIGNGGVAFYLSGYLVDVQ